MRLHRGNHGGEGRDEVRDAWLVAEFTRRMHAGYVGAPAMLLVELIASWERGEVPVPDAIDVDAIDAEAVESMPTPGKSSRAADRYPRVIDTPQPTGSSEPPPAARRPVPLGDFFGGVLDAEADARATRALRIADTDRARRRAIEGQVLELADVLALDPWGLEIVVDRRAAARLASLGVRGMQEGTTLWLDPDVYDPGTETGRYLLAHEMVHVAQRRLPASLDQGRWAAEAEANQLGHSFARGAAVARPSFGVSDAAPALDTPQPDEEKLLANPPVLSRTVGMVGIVYRPTTDAKWVGGIDKKKQAFGAFISDLVTPAKYSVKLLNDTITAVGGIGSIEATGKLDGTATQEDKVSEFTVKNRIALQTDEILRKNNYKTTLTDENRKVMQGGVDAEDTWEDIQPLLPGWWTKGIYMIMMGATQGTKLLRYGELYRNWQKTKSDDDELKLGEHRDAVYKALMRPAGNALEAIRRDGSLASEPAFRVLWKLPAPDVGAKPADEVKVGRDGPVDEMSAIYFMTDCMAQPGPAELAVSSRPARKKLLDDFATRLKLRKLPTDGDATLHDGATKATRPPLSSTLRAWPTLEQPFYDVPKGSDREFVMSIGFPDVFEAFRGYRYKWELMQVPDEDVKKLAEYEDPKDKAKATGDNVALRGDSPGQLSVLGGRLERDAADGATDIKRSIFSLSNLLGPPGMGATTLVTVNAMLRMVGTVIRTFIETLTKPSYEKTMPFAKDGLYVVRCIAWPTPADNSVIDRSPSVSWMPVWVRPTKAMAELRSHYDVKNQGAAIDRLKAIEDALKDPMFLDPANKDAKAALEQERDNLKKTLYGTGEDQLNLEKNQLVEAQKKETDEYRKTKIAERIKEIDKILEMRADRMKGAVTDGSLEGVFKIPAAFVGFKGTTMRPFFEAFQKKTSKGYTYHVVDSTTKNSGHRDGSGDTREEAISNAVIAILESDQGYGRGFVTLQIPPQAGTTGGKPIEKTIEIAKSAGALAMEAVENIAMVASIAAIAAAPFTGGASLSLLIPIGIIGAIPSAYRLLDRAEQGVLRLDFAAVMDIVNILAAALTAGTAKAASSAALKGIPVATGYVILGLGNDALGIAVMGAGFVHGIMELEKEDPKMPPGLRAARIAELFGNTLLQAGMAIGAHLVAKAQADIAKFGGKKTAESVGPRVTEETVGKFRELVGPKGQDIPVYRDEKGATVKGDGVEVHFNTDGYGLPTDVHVVMGPSATAEGLAGHAKAAKAAVEYQGFVGYLRNLLDRLTVLFQSGKLPPKEGSRAWIAKTEIEKLKGIIGKLNNDLGTGAITPEAYASKLKDYQQQMQKHEQSLNDYSTGAKGVIAAHDTATTEAQGKGYPAPPKDHFYYETGDGKYQLQRAAESAEPAQHIEWKDNKPVLATGEPKLAPGAVVDITQIKTVAEQNLGKPVVVNANATGPEVRVRPTASGYELNFAPGTPEHAIQSAIEKHLELRAARPDDLKKPIKKTDGTKWTGADEAAYQGRPKEEGYHWSLTKDGALVPVSDDLDKFPKKKWDEPSQKLVPDTGAKADSSFDKGTTKAEAFELLGGNDPSSEFGAWVKAVETYLGIDKETLIGKMKNPSELNYRTVRSGLKENITPELVKKISLNASGVANDRAFLQSRQPDAYKGATTPDQLKAADRIASHQEMLKMTENMGSGDRGSVAERWYHSNYAPTAEKHVVFEKEAMAKQGVTLDIDRNPDIIDKSKIREMKHTSDRLGKRDLDEIADYTKLLDKTLKVGDTTYNLKEMIVVFPEPTGGSANADNIAKMVTDRRISADVFNSKGQTMHVDAGTLAAAGSAEKLIAQIKDFCK